MKLINEDNQLKQMATFNKKRQKGMSPFTKLDAGDVEHNQAFFNNAMGSGECDGGACMAESYDEEDEFETSALAGSFSMEINEAEDIFDVECAEYAIIAAYEDGDLSESDFDALMQDAEDKRYELESKADDEDLDESVNNTMRSSCEGSACAESLTESLSRFADTDEQEESLQAIEEISVKIGVSLRYGTSIGKNPQTIILDHKYNDGMISVDPDGYCTFSFEGMEMDEKIDPTGEPNHFEYVLKHFAEGNVDEFFDLEESIEEIEADEKKVEPQTINLRQALNEIDKTTMNTDFVNMYEVAKLTLEEKQKLALMLAKGEDINAIYDFLAARCDKYLHSESHLVENSNGPSLRSVANFFSVVGPSSRGDAYPEYDEYALNETNIPDGMRFKTYNIEVIADDTIQLDYITQEGFTSADSKQFIKEAHRAFDSIAYAVGYDNPFTVALNVRCRDGRAYGSLVYDLKIGE